MKKPDTIRLTYMSAKALAEYKDKDHEAPAQPCVVHPAGMTPFRVVPIAPMLDSQLKLLECIGCIGENGTNVGERISCLILPDCSNAIFVRATPANKVKHIAWLLDNLEKNN